ncbi:hypothetical protein D3C73_1298110 [compost metagenome]
MLDFTCRPAHDRIGVICQIPHIGERQAAGFPLKLQLNPQGRQRPHVQPLPCLGPGRLHPGNHGFAFFPEQMLRPALQLAKVEAVLRKIDAGTKCRLQFIRADSGQPLAEAYLCFFRTKRNLLQLIHPVAGFRIAAAGAES